GKTTRDFNYLLLHRMRRCVLWCRWLSTSTTCFAGTGKISLGLLTGSCTTGSATTASSGLNRTRRNARRGEVVLTRLPTENRLVEGFEGPEYELNVICAAPGCSEQASDTHHLWRRSELVGAYAWVRFPDGTIVGNLVKLCRKHHEQLTVNAAWI